jgi:PadR family transcriptional regulator, regulatory protein PadR
MRHYVPLTPSVARLKIRVMNPEMLKGHLDNIVLASLRSGPAHGYGLIEFLRQRSGGHFDLPEGTVYPALHRLELAGLIESSWGKSPQGRKRRVYALTRKGIASLEQRQSEWSKFAEAVRYCMGEGEPCLS